MKAIGDLVLKLAIVLCIYLGTPYLLPSKANHIEILVHDLVGLSIKTQRNLLVDLQTNEVGQDLELLESLYYPTRPDILFFGYSIDPENPFSLSTNVLKLNEFEKIKIWRCYGFVVIRHFFDFIEMRFGFWKQLLDWPKFLIIYCLLFLVLYFGIAFKRGTKVD